MIYSAPASCDAETACMVHIDNYFAEKFDQIYELERELRSGEFGLVVQTPRVSMVLGDALFWAEKAHEGDESARVF